MVRVPGSSGPAKGRYALSRPVVDVGKLEKPIGELRGDQVDDYVVSSGLHVGKFAVSERCSYVPGVADRRCVGHEIGDSALSALQGPGMGRAVGAELLVSVGDPGKEPLAGALVAADAAQVRNISPAEPLSN